MDVLQSTDGDRYCDRWDIWQYCLLCLYAKTGEATVQVEIKNFPERLELTFIDKGIPYNPLENKDPDVTLDIEKRKIGGLGIFLVKEMMDEVSYEYADGKIYWN